MEIITLQAYTDQYVSLYEGEIRNLPNDIALRLINKGVAAQHDKDILNSTTSDDNGKVLTVVNGKPTFSAPATVNGGNSAINYVIYYSNNSSQSFLYKEPACNTLVTIEQFIQNFQDKDFIIIHIHIPYDQYEKTAMYFVYYYSTAIDENDKTYLKVVSCDNNTTFFVGESDVNPQTK